MLVYHFAGKNTKPQRSVKYVSNATYMVKPRFKLGL